MLDYFGLKVDVTQFVIINYNITLHAIASERCLVEDLLRNNGPKQITSHKLSLFLRNPSIIEPHPQADHHFRVAYRSSDTAGDDRELHYRYPEFPPSRDLQRLTFIISTTFPLSLSFVRVPPLTGHLCSPATLHTNRHNVL